MIEVIADPLNTSRTFRPTNEVRVVFEPTDVDHRRALFTYLSTGRWTLQFHVEMPYSTVPDTVMQKYARWSLANEFNKPKKSA